jgi:hypothetical protein
VFVYMDPTGTTRLFLLFYPSCTSLSIHLCNQIFRLLCNYVTLLHPPPFLSPPKSVSLHTIPLQPHPPPFSYTLSIFPPSKITNPKISRKIKRTAGTDGTEGRFCYVYPLAINGRTVPLFRLKGTPPPQRCPSVPPQLLRRFHVVISSAVERSRSFLPARQAIIVNYNFPLHPFSFGTFLSGFSLSPSNYYSSIHLTKENRFSCSI